MKIQMFLPIILFTFWPYYASPKIYNLNQYKISCQYVAIPIHAKWSLLFDLKFLNEALAGLLLQIYFNHLVLPSKTCYHVVH